jgi:hypothetical protein
MTATRRKRPEPKSPAFSLHFGRKNLKAPEPTMEPSNSAPYTVKKNAVQSLLFFLTALATLLIRKGRLQGNAGLSVSPGE